MSVKRVVVTGAAGQIAYSLLFRIAAGEMFGKEQKVDLVLVDIEAAQNGLEGVAMELQDSAFSMLEKVSFGHDFSALVEGADLVLLVGARPRTLGMERKDLLQANSQIFASQGRFLARASKEVVVFVVGNPCNTNALILAHHAKIDPKRIHAMTQLDLNRAKAFLAEKLVCHARDVEGVIIWGNHSSTQVPDISHLTVKEKKVVLPFDAAFVEKVQKRGAEVIAKRGSSSAASAASALIHLVKNTLEPTKEGLFYSSAIYSDQNPYGIDPNLFFSFPVVSRGEGKVEIVPYLNWPPELASLIARTEKELIEERDAVVEFLK